MNSDFETVILSACRTPIGAFGGAFKDVPAVDLATIVIREAIARAGVQAADVGDVIMGCVLQAGAGMNVARQAALKAGLPVEVPGETVNRVCGSGLQAVVHAVEAIRVGYVDTIVAGGTESMSNAPYLLRGARWGYRMGNAEVLDSMLNEGLMCAIGNCHMGMTAEEVAKRYRISREDQDRFAAESQARAQRAMTSGAFAAEIVPVAVPQRKGEPVRVSTDEYPRAGTTFEKLSELKAAFLKKEGTVTAGNASGVNDGAAALVVTSADKAKKIGRQPLARILAYVSTGVDPAVMGMGPVPAVRKVLDRAGLKVDDIDLFELNEAFASVVLRFMQAFEIDHAKINVNGGAIAMGHPLGATGAMILGTVLDELDRRGLQTALVTLCIGAGMGTATIIERV
jgi:acetyl-CoA C-acetyltransferase